MYADTKGKQKIEGQTMQWPNEKPKDTQTMAHKKIHIKLKIEQYETTKTGGKCRCSGRVSTSCSTSDIYYTR